MPRKKTIAKSELPEEYEELARVHLSTLTAAAFLAPKGVPCTLDRLVLTVRSLSAIELTAIDLRKMAALDDRLALRHAVTPQGDQQLELVLRESLKLNAKASAVASRHSRFRKLLSEHAWQPSEIGASPPLALAPLPANAQGVAPPSSPPRRPPIDTASTATASGSPASVSGLPSPPPNPLRRGLQGGSSGEGGTGMRESSGGGMRASSGGESGTEHTDGDTASGGSVGDGSLPRDQQDGETRGGGGGALPGSAGDGTRVAPSKRPASSTCRFLDALMASSFYKGQIAHTHEVPARPAEYTELRSVLAPAVQSVLAAKGLTRLYSHQAAAIDALIGGGHVMLSTPTASGKSLGYTVPALHAMATSAEARAIFIFPTKALAQDQLRHFTSFADRASPSLLAASLDGDTPQVDRRQLRQRCHVFLTNPDLLHTTLLPQHEEWAEVPYP